MTILRLGPGVCNPIFLGTQLLKPLLSPFCLVEELVLNIHYSITGNTLIKYIYYHIVHPPMLPQHNETEASDQEEPLEWELYRLVSSTFEDFASNYLLELTGSWNIMINILNLLILIKKRSTLYEDTLRDALFNI